MAFAVAQNKTNEPAILKTGPRRRPIAPLLLLTPLVIVIVLMVAFPILYSVFISVHHDTVATGLGSWSGLLHYKETLSNGAFWASILFSLKYVVVVTVLEVVFGFALALLVNRSFPAKGAAITIILASMMSAASLYGLMYSLMMNQSVGIIPYYLSKIGLNISLFNPHAIVPLVMAIDIFQWTPFTFLIIYSGLQTIPIELYEAAQMDGANRWHVLRRITIPLLTPIIGIATFIRAVDAFKTFDMIYVLTQGGPGSLTTSASIFLYNTAFRTGDLATASAASTIVVLLLVPFLILFMKTVMRGSVAS